MIAALPSTFSLTQVILTAFVTLLVSGLGGALVQRFLARARPKLILLSVAFEGSDGLIEVSEKLVDLAREDPWGRGFDKFETFNTLKERETSSAELDGRLGIAIRICEDWINTITDSGASQIQLKQSEVFSHPYMIDSLVGSSLDGMINRSEIDDPPITNEALSEEKVLFELIEREEDLFVYLGVKAVKFPMKDMWTDSSKKLMRSIAMSFSHGNGENILHFTRVFINHAKEERLRIKEMRETLEEILLEHAKLNVRATFVNRGRTAIAFKPYFRLQLFHKHLQTKGFLMEPQHEQVSEPANPLAELVGSKKPNDQGRKVSVEEFLPSSSTAPYLSLAAEQAKEILLVALEPMSDQGKQVYEIYKTGVLECSLTAMKFNGKPLKSESAVFGSTISKDLADELQ